MIIFLHVLCPFGLGMLSLTCFSVAGQHVTFSAYSVEESALNGAAEASAVEVNNVTVYLGSYLPVRYEQYDVDESGMMVRGRYARAVMVQAAVRAFASGVVITPPGEYAPYNLHVLFADTCSSNETCSSVEALDLMTHMMLGHWKDETQFPTIRGMVGGYYSSNGMPIVRLASSRKIPHLGMQLSHPDLSDREAFPFFASIKPTMSTQAPAFLALYEYCNFTRVTLWGSDDTFGRGMAQPFVRAAEARHFTVQTIMVPLGEITGGYPPGGPGFFQPGPEDVWSGILGRARSFNAHAHLAYISPAAAYWDVMSYLHLQGFVGLGYFWMGNNFISPLYHERYVGPMRQYAGPYAAVNPWDGFLQLDGQVLGETWETFWTWWASFRNRSAELLDSWIADHVPEIAFVDPEDTFLEAENAVVFDTTWAMLAATNRVLLEHGLSFTGEQLLNEIRQSDFEGLTGRVVFDDAGNIVAFYGYSSYQRACGGDTMDAGGFPSMGEMVPVGSYFGGPELSRPMLFFSCTTEAPPDVDLPCSPGMFYHRVTAECVPCPPGSVSAEVGQAWCDACPKGTYSDPVGRSVCLACEAGAFSSEDGAVSCTDCSSGEYADSIQQTGCRTCWAGSYTNSTGWTACALCEIGRFAVDDGESVCAACGHGTEAPELWTTMKRVTRFGITALARSEGSTDDGSCGCDEGTRPSGGECMPCGVGLRCDGMDDFGVQPGYAWDGGRTSGGISPVFRCYGGAARCPGGEPGLCAEGRHGLGCAECFPGWAAASEGRCRECGSTDNAPFVLTCCVILGALAIAYFKIDLKDRARTSQAVVLMAVSGGQFVQVLQMLSVLELLSVEQADPLGSLLSAMRLLSFNLEIVRLGCVASMDPIGRYTSQLLVFVACVVGMLLVHTAFVLIKYGGEFRTQMPTLVHATGVVFQVFFISTACTTLIPFQCIDHPNGVWTLRSYPSVVCWESRQHEVMLAVGVVGLVLPMAFLADSANAVCRLPKMVRSVNLKFLKSYDFLFFRFRPDLYWFALVVLLRSLLISMVPIIPDVVWQVIIMQLLLLGSIMLTAFTFPFHNGASSMLDLAILGTVAVVMLFGAFNVEGADVVLLSEISLGLIVFTAAAVVCTATYGTFMQYFHRAKSYKYFVCHRKASAGATARLLKMALSYPPDVGRVFLDSDNLTNPTDLFDCVRAKTDSLVVLCSDGLLRCSWCVGEIATAIINKVTILPVHCADFDPPDDGYIEKFDQLIRDLSCLATGGISISRAQAALRTFRDLPAISFFTQLTSGDLEALVAKIKRSCQQGRISISGMVSTAACSDVASIQPHVSVLVDKSNREAVAVAHILRRSMLPHTVRDSKQIPYMCTDFSEGGGLASSVCEVVIVCSSDCMRRLEFLHLLVCAAELGAASLPVIGQAGFQFPSRVLYDELRSDAKALCARMVESGLRCPAGYRSKPWVLAEIIADIFKDVAVMFEAQGSMLLIDSQAKQVASRVLDPHKRLLALEASEQQADGHPDTETLKLDAIIYKLETSEQKPTAAMEASPMAAGAPVTAALEGTMAASAVTTARSELCSV